MYLPLRQRHPSPQFPFFFPEAAMPDPEPRLDHERLDVYQLARQLARESSDLLGRLPGGRADMTDQFRRAALSLPLNLAEGAGEFAPKEKARFYRIAKRSATECSAVLDHMVDLNLLTPADVRHAKTLIRRIVGAMVKLILSTEKQPPPPPTPPLPLKRVRVRVPATSP
jgi:four helix bundle protein